MWSASTGSMGAAPNSRPRKAESPPPRIVSAIPAAYWFARRLSASTPKTRDEAAPASTPAPAATGSGYPANAK